MLARKPFMNYYCILYFHTSLLLLPYLYCKYCVGGASTVVVGSVHGCCQCSQSSNSVISLFKHEQLVFFKYVRECYMYGIQLYFECHVMCTVMFNEGISKYIF